MKHFLYPEKMMIESIDGVGGRCMRGNNGALCLIENDKAKLWSAHTSKLMNEEHE